MRRSADDDSVRRRLRDAGAEGYFQIVAVEWIDVNHPPEGLRKKVSTGSFAIGGVCDLAGESETSVSHEAQAAIQSRRRGTRSHRHHAGHLGLSLAKLAAQQISPRDPFGQ